MTYTNCGTKVRAGMDWCPLAMANGIEWARYRKMQADRWNNLYRFRHAPVSYLLWYCGAVLGWLRLVRITERPS